METFDERIHISWLGSESRLRWRFKNGPTRHPLARVVSFYTLDDLYTDHADRLVASLEAADVPYSVFGIDRPFGEAGKWESVCAIKSRFMEWACGAHGCDCLAWIDADAEVVSPGRFNQVVQGFILSRKAIGVYRPDKDILPGDESPPLRRYPGLNSRLLSGTLLWNPGQANLFALPTKWAKRQKQSGAAYDQETLYDTIQFAGCPVFDLPAGMVCIPDLMPGCEPIVLQHQASRQSKSRFGSYT